MLVYLKWKPFSNELEGAVRKTVLYIVLEAQEWIACPNLKPASINRKWKYKTHKVFFKNPSKSNVMDILLYI